MRLPTLPSLPERFRPPQYTLSMYIGGRFLAIFLGDVFLFAVIYSLIDSLHQYDAFMKRSEGSFFEFLRVAFTYYYYELPSLFCRVLGPVVTMASAMFAVTLTARANEFVPILATGTSLRRAIFPIVALTVLIAAGSMALQEIWIPGHRSEIRLAKTFGKKYGELRHAYYTDSKNGVYVAARRFYPGEQRAEGVWIRMDRPEGDLIYTAEEALWDAERTLWTLRRGELQRYDREGLIVSIDAPSAATTPQEEPVHPGAKPKRHVPRLTEAFDTHEFAAAGMIPQDLEGSESQDQYLPATELRRKASISPDRHRWMLKYYARFVDPLNHLILLLIGVPAVFFRGTRNVFLSAILAVLIGTSYFVLHAIVVYLGSREILSPALAAWLVPMAFTALGTTMYVGMRS